MSERAFKINDQFQIRIDHHGNHMPDEMVTAKPSDANPEPQPAWKHMGGYYKKPSHAIRSIALKIELRKDVDRTLIDYMKSVISTCQDLESQMESFLSNAVSVDLKAIDVEIKKPAESESSAG